MLLGEKFHVRMFYLEKFNEKGKKEEEKKPERYFAELMDFHKV